MIERVYELLTAALSLVAALAWNDAAQSLFKIIFGDAGSVYAKFLYAILITTVIVFTVSRLNKMTKTLRSRLIKQ